MTLTWHELGWRPEELGNHQISVNGLGAGGSYTVKIRVPGDDTYQVHQAGALETDTVVIDRPLPAAFQITFAGVGGGDTPKVFVTGWQKPI